MSTSDLDAVYEYLLDAGVKTEGPPTDRSWGERDLHVRDPDGNRIELGVGEAGWD
jgi:uncharacterized glyoxalase superfamily protein PhnB